MNLPLRKLFFCLACSGLSNGFTQEVSTIGRTDDVWDVSQGAVVTRITPLDAAMGEPDSYDARDIFGGDFGKFAPERFAVIFSDDLVPGFVNFVEWRTKSPVTIRSFRLFAAEDEDHLYRGFTKFRLLAKPLGSTQFSVVLHEFEPKLPFTYLHDPFLLIESDTKTVIASEFRAEFVSRTDLPMNQGPRIIELDGFTDPLETQASIRTSEVEVCWDSIANVRYRVEYKSQLPNSEWVTVGEQSRVGTGGRMCVADRLPNGAESRFYRVRRLD